MRTWKDAIDLHIFVCQVKIDRRFFVHGVILLPRAMTTTMCGGRLSSQPTPQHFVVDSPRALNQISYANHILTLLTSKHSSFPIPKKNPPSIHKTPKQIPKQLMPLSPLFLPFYKENSSK